MIRLFATILSSFSLLWIGLGVGVWWEAGRPAGWPSYTLNLPLGIHHTFRLPDGSGAKYRRMQVLEGQWVTALKTCQANTVTLTGALARQNQAVEALRSASDAKLAAAAQAVLTARSATAAAQSSAARLLAMPLTAGDTCQRVLAVDDAFLAELK